MTTFDYITCEELIDLASMPIELLLEEFGISEEDFFLGE